MITNKYEAAMIFSVANGDEGVAALNEKFKALIEANGTIESVDEWGKRHLAYPINDETEGFYVFVNFTAGTDFPVEFERIAGITDGMLRLMITRK